MNHVYIEAEFEKLSGEQLVALKETLNTLFYRSVATLDTDDDDVASSSVNAIRICNAMATLCALIRGVTRNPGMTQDCGFDVINLLIGFDSADSVMQVKKVKK